MGERFQNSNKTAEIIVVHILIFSCTLDTKYSNSFRGSNEPRYARVVLCDACPTEGSVRGSKYYLSPSVSTTQAPFTFHKAGTGSVTAVCTMYSPGTASCVNTRHGNSSPKATEFQTTTYN
jgi:hypothetical protein